MQVIRDVMHKGVVTCSVSTTVEDALSIMLDNSVPLLVVVDERADACGLITKTDVARCYGKDLTSIAAEDIMSEELLTVSPSGSVKEAVQQMLDHKIHQLVITTEGGEHRRPVGIFTIGDAVALMAGQAGAER